MWLVDVIEIIDILGWIMFNLCWEIFVVFFIRINMAKIISKNNIVVNSYLCCCLVCDGDLVMGVVVGVLIDIEIFF